MHTVIIKKGVKNMKTVTYTLYEFNELSAEAQEKAIENLSDINVDYDWYDLEYWQEKLDAIGFEGAEINFSDFWSQGDGASFIASVNLEKIISYMAYCTDNYNDIKDFYKLERLQYYGMIDLNIEIIRQSSRYAHENTCAISHDFQAYSNAIAFEKWLDRVISKFIDQIEDLRRSLCFAIYYALRQDYEYLISPEAIQETIEINKYYFYETGKLA
jgi:hypothetical protein